MKNELIKPSIVNTIANMIIAQDKRVSKRVSEVIEDYISDIVATIMSNKNKIDNLTYLELSNLQQDILNDLVSQLETHGIEYYPE